MDCSPPGSSAHGILQARILEWVAMPFSRGSSCQVRCSIVPSADISCIVHSCIIREPTECLEGATFFQVQNISQPMNNQHRSTTEHRELCSMCVAAWFGGEWIHVIHMAEALYLATETVTALLIGYTKI